MKKILALLLLSPTLVLAVDYKALYYETESRLNELESRLSNAKEENVKLVKENQKIEPLTEKVKKYNNYVLIHDLVPTSYRDTFEKYYTLMHNYVTEWENNKRINLEHHYNSENFIVLKSYVQENLSEVTFNNNNEVYVDGVRLVK